MFAILIVKIIRTGGRRAVVCRQPEHGDMNAPPKKTTLEHADGE